jgi:hypothetical protein
MRPTRPPRAILLGLLLSCLSGAVQAQSYWHDDAGRAQYRLELLKPFLDDLDESFFSGAAFLTGSFLLGTGIRLEGELPVSSASFTADLGGGPVRFSGSRVGNPYLGLVLHRAERPLAFRAGVRLPLMGDFDEFADIPPFTAGSSSDFDRVEAFLPSTVTPKVAMEWQKVEPGGLLFGLLIGSTVPINDDFGHADWWGDYGLRIGYRGERVQAHAALTGRINLTSDDFDALSERTQHQVTGVVLLRSGRVRPEFTVRLPLDADVREVVPVVVGAGVRLVF